MNRKALYVPLKCSTFITILRKRAIRLSLPVEGE